MAKKNKNDIDTSTHEERIARIYKGLAYEIRYGNSPEEQPNHTQVSTEKQKKHVQRIINQLVAEGRIIAPKSSEKEKQKTR